MWWYDSNLFPPPVVVPSIPTDCMISGLLSVATHSSSRSSRSWCFPACSSASPPWLVPAPFPSPRSISPASPAGSCPWSTLATCVLKSGRERTPMRLHHMLTPGTLERRGRPGQGPGPTLSGDLRVSTSRHRRREIPNHHLGSITELSWWSTIYKILGFSGSSGQPYYCQFSHIGVILSIFIF